MVSQKTKRFFYRLPRGLILFLPWLVFGQTSPPPKPPVFGITTELVNVDFRVTTKKGELVQGNFRPEDLEVYENGVRQVITHFSNLDGPLTAILLIDYSKQSFLISYYSQDEVWVGPLEFVRSLKNQDWTAIATYDIKVNMSPNDAANGVYQDFTQNKTKLENTLANIFRSRPAWSESNLVDAVKTILDLTEDNDSLQQRVALILISTGLDTFSKNTYDSVLKQAPSSGVTIFSVGIGQQLRLRLDPYLESTARLDWLAADNRLRALADLTGGQAYFPRFTAEMHGIFEDISQQLRNQYSLGYVSTNQKRDGKFRKIEIQVKKTATNRKGKEEKLIAHHRRGYYALKD